jgi:hypothetical protein
MKRSNRLYEIQKKIKRKYGTQEQRTRIRCPGFKVTISAGLENGFLDGLSLATFTLSFGTLGINADAIRARRYSFFVRHKCYKNLEIVFYFARLETIKTKAEGQALHQPLVALAELSKALDNVDAAVGVAPLIIVP